MEGRSCGCEPMPRSRLPCHRRVPAPGFAPKAKWGWDGYGLGSAGRPSPRQPPRPEAVTLAAFRRCMDIAYHGRSRLTGRTRAGTMTESVRMRDVCPTASSSLPAQGGQACYSGRSPELRSVRTTLRQNGVNEHHGDIVIAAMLFGDRNKTRCRRSTAAGREMVQRR